MPHVLAVDSHAPAPSCSRRTLVLGAIGALVGGCAAPGAAPRAPEPLPDPVTLVVSLASAADTNPDVRGRASPIAVRVYELRSTSAFESADFFALFERDAATLGGDLVGRVEAILRPGETQELVRKAGAETRYVGVVAAYRDLEHSVWRLVAPVAPPAVPARGAAAPRQQRVRLTFERAAVRMDVAPVS